jgi:hypothetical protein
VGVETNVSLIVATLDLQLVRLLRGAIRAADRSAAPNAALSPAARFEPRPVIHPTPHFEPRRVHHPEPRFEPRPVERPKATPDCIPLNSAPCCPEKPRLAKSPIEPPWKTLPWENPPPPAQVVKLVIRRPDNSSKGSIIDCFI